MLDFPLTIANDPSKKGQLAARKQFFGSAKRYAIAPVHTRFDAVQWFVWDAEFCDDKGYATVTRQEDTLEAALEGLDMSAPFEYADFGYEEDQ